MSTPKLAPTVRLWRLYAEKHTGETVSLGAFRGTPEYSEYRATHAFATYPPQWREAVQATYKRVYAEPAY